MTYAELHCKTNFSFLEAASHPEELVERAAALGYAALAITDSSSLAGVVRAHVAAKMAGLKLVIGAEISPDDAPPVVLWVTDRAAYGRLTRLITLGRRRAAKGQCHLTLDDVAAHAGGLIAGVCPPDGLLPESGPEHDRLIAALDRYREMFAPDGCFLLAHLHRGADDARRLAQLAALSHESRLPLVAAGDVRYHIPARMPLFDVLTAIRHGTTVAEAGDLLLPNAQRHLRSIEEIARAFAHQSEASHDGHSPHQEVRGRHSLPYMLLRRTVEIAARCTFSLDELRYEYPEELVPPGTTLIEHLARCTWAGARQRYPRGIPEKVRRLVEHELELIEELHYEAYFLTVWDLVCFARRRGILCQGRGSAANSAVCYCLGVTAVDPERMDVLFERFVSRERNEAPDIDVDFEHERREEVLQYLYEKYGRERAGMTAVVITYRTRSAIRDVGKALGLSLDRVDTLAKNIDGHHYEPHLDRCCRQEGIDPGSPTGQRLVHLVEELIGFPRHLSQHVGGMVMTRGPLCELVPLENAAMPGRTVIQWNKDDLDELGILKVDCLSLGMLTAIRKSFELIERHHGRRLTLAGVPREDPAVYDMICRADTMGVFQIESRAQMSMLPRLKPRCYYDLVIEVAIVRPGPIQGQMVHPYLRRRAGEEEVTYPSEAIREVLEKTLGVPLFQEQAMRLAVVAAGFTPGEADQLRRAMGAWRRPGIIDRFERKLIEGMLQRGLSRRFAEQVFQQIRGFGEYGFPESHAASFAQLVYVSAWLKHYYPDVFVAALLNSQPMGFYAPAQLVRDARDHRVEVRPADVGHSRWDCTLEQNNTLEQNGNLPRYALRLGFRLLAWLSPSHIEAIERARDAGSFRSVAEFARRTGLSRMVLEHLARADAFGSLGQSRRSALWHVLECGERLDRRPLFMTCPADDEPPVALPDAPLEQEVFDDYRASGLSLRAHPLSFCRAALDQMGVLPAGKLVEMSHNRSVRVGGLVLLRQRPSTARGITFVTLEDETGIANLVVRQDIWERYARVARHAPAWIAHGRLERKDSIIHILVGRLEDLSARLRQLRVRSRDFR